MPREPIDEHSQRRLLGDKTVKKTKTISRRAFFGQSSAASLVVLASQKVSQAKPINVPREQVAGSAIEQKVDAIIARMTLEEKIQMVHGERLTGFIGYVPAIPRLGIPELTLTDGPAGIRHGPGTAFPAPVALAASWDRALAESYGAAMGAEAKAKGQNILLAPMVNIVRVPEGGRNFETFGEDPYLTAQIATADIKGIQSQGVIAEVKHYAANNQEKQRLTVSAEVDERTLREIYLPAFEAAVKEARVGSVMAAYNKVNGTHSSENTHLLKDILKNEWGFDGFAVSDWGATHSTIAAANNGLDMEMPTGEFFGAKLSEAVKTGQVSEATINDKVRRILRIMMRFGFFDRPAAIGPIDYNVQAQVGRRVAEAGVVLLKNEGSLLPLDLNRLKSIAIIGAYVDRATSGGGGSARMSPLYTISPLGAITQRVGERIAVKFVRFVPGNDLSKSDPATTGAALIADTVKIAKSCDLAIVFARDFETEGDDRANIDLPDEQDQMITAVLGANKRTIVVLNTGAIVLLNKWVDSAPAVIQAWYPGQDDGNVIADVLFGVVNPSGKLPLTFPRARQDVAVSSPEQYPGVSGKGQYSEGIFIGYRHFDKHKIDPIFPFGHGLSYTTFAYSNLKLSRTQIKAGEPLTVEVVVKNTGRRQGAEVVQLYIQDLEASVERPIKELKGFEKVRLKPGQSQLIKFGLNDRSLAFYDPAHKRWVVEPGQFQVMVGSSSRDIRLTTTFSVT
ncbi:MAG TPA: glycosyl hydrolase [Blastocatellia bacterium]|nr:glycosyl hydrolase [Blastocatellia bacterium]